MFLCVAKVWARFGGRVEERGGGFGGGALPCSSGVSLCLNRGAGWRGTLKGSVAFSGSGGGIPTLGREFSLKYLRSGGRGGGENDGGPESLGGSKGLTPPGMGTFSRGNRGLSCLSGNSGKEWGWGSGGEGDRGSKLAPTGRV